MDAKIYTIRVEGHLDHHWSSRLADLTIRRQRDGTSTLTGPIADQAQLHGVLTGLRDIGAVLLDLHAAGTPATPGMTAAQQRSPDPHPAHERNST